MSRFDAALTSFRATFATIPAGAPVGDLDGIDFDREDLGGSRA